MKARASQSRFIPLPSWILSILASIVIAFIVGKINASHPGIAETTSYIIWAGLIVAVCFFLGLNDPGSAWYVPILCNILSLLPAIFDASFWTTSFGIIIFAGIGLSFAAAFLGARQGKSLASKGPGTGQ